VSLTILKGETSDMVWDKLANKYDRLWVQKYSLTPTRNEVLKRILQLEEVNNILDVGCGTGQLLNEIHEQNAGINLFGIDKSEQMIACAKNKNFKANFFNLDIDDKIDLDISFDIIACCNSFPYYKNKPEVLSRIHKMLNADGYAILVQASIITFYDRIVMWFVEKTAEKAEYLSKQEFVRLLSDKFKIVEEINIHEKWFMPSICGYMVKKI